MVSVSIEEIRRDPSGFLRRVEAGETLLIVRGGEPMAEITPIEPRSEEKALRPFGLSAGDFTVPDDFDEPLPEETLRGFEGR